MLELSVQTFVWVSQMGICKRLHWSLGRLDFIHMCQLAKVKYYLKVVKSSNSVIHNVF